MALIKCRECGSEISRKAIKCPKCGAPAAKKMFSTSGIVLLLIVGWFVYSSYDSPPETITDPLLNNPPPSAMVSTEPKIQPHENATTDDMPPQELPSGENYSIISVNDLQKARRTIDVRLNKKVSRGVLTTIGSRLKNSEHNAFDRTYILYYLPGMEVGSGAWATTHYTPKSEVKISWSFS